ncbi:MAG: hypothetical protein U0794_10015 [Isosphaeraceae bacterium]
MNATPRKRHEFRPDDVGHDNRLESREVLSTMLPRPAALRSSIAPISYFDPTARRVPLDWRNQPIFHGAQTPAARTTVNPATVPQTATTPVNPVSYYNPLERRIPVDWRTQPIAHGARMFRR